MISIFLLVGRKITIRLPSMIIYWKFMSYFEKKVVKPEAGKTLAIEVQNNMHFLPVLSWI